MKPGSYMPPSYLRHGSDMRTEVAGNRGHVRLYCLTWTCLPLQECLRSWLELNFARKRCFLLPAALYPHISVKYHRQYRRQCRRYFGGMEPILGDPGADSGGEGKCKRTEKYGTKKSKERREEPLGTMSYQTSSKRSPPFCLLIGARKLLCFSAQFFHAVLYFSSGHIFPPV